MLVSSLPPKEAFGILFKRRIYIAFWIKASFGGKELTSTGVCLVAQMVKNPPAMQETWILFKGQEDPLEKAMATHSSILAWRIP